MKDKKVKRKVRQCKEENSKEIRVRGCRIWINVMKICTDYSLLVNDEILRITPEEINENILLEVR